MKTLRYFFYITLKILLLAELCGFQVAVARQCPYTSEEELVKVYGKEVAEVQSHRQSAQKRVKRSRTRASSKEALNVSLAPSHTSSNLSHSQPSECFTFRYFQRDNGIGCPLRL